MSSALQLAAFIDGLSRDRLELLLRGREVNPSAEIADSLSLATALLKPESIRRALSGLRAEQLQLLWGLAPEAPADRALTAQLEELNTLTELSDLGLLIGPTSNEPAHTLDEVTAQLEKSEHTLLAETPEAGTVDELSAAEDLTAAAVPASNGAIEQAFDAVRTAEQLLTAAADLRLAQRTAQPSVTAARAIAAHTSLDESRVAIMQSVLFRAAALRVSRGRLDANLRLLADDSLDRAQRFGRLAHAWAQQLSPLARTAVLASEAEFPLASKTQLEQVQQVRHEALALGLLEPAIGDAKARVNTLGAAVLAPAGSTADTVWADLASRFPAEVDTFYVQPDLSIVAPGPLGVALESQLLKFATLESAGLASSYRLSSRSLQQGVQHGVSVEQMRELLSTHSIGELPQPVRYLLDEVESKLGSVVLELAPDATTAVRCRDASIAEQLAVDVSLKPLRLERIEDTVLRTPLAPEQIVDAMRDASYFVTLSHSGQGSAPGEEASSNEFDAIITAIVHAREQPHDGNERMLELAARERSTVLVEIEMPDGSAKSLRLRVVGFANGRLRGIDEAAQVERTVPASIVRVVEFSA